MSKDQILFSVWTLMVVVVRLHLVDLSSNTATITSSSSMQGTTSFLRTFLKYALPPRHYIVAFNIMRDAEQGAAWSGRQHHN